MKTKALVLLFSLLIATSISPAGDRMPQPVLDAQSPRLTKAGDKLQLLWRIEHAGEAMEEGALADLFFSIEANGRVGEKGPATAGHAAEFTF
jgi:hypothetical protein